MNKVTTLFQDFSHDDGQLSAGRAQQLLQSAQESMSSVIWGQPQAVQLLLASMIARGHVLVEDVPGVGKTTLARAVAQVLGCVFSRIQFTADMLPADVTGVQVLDPKDNSFVFRRGPIFAQVVLADEINRASPKTQSAMLEAMSELQVTVDERTYQLPEVFAVLATQNPVEHHGVYPLPESQLDRFMVRLTMGYPPHSEERQLILSPAEPTKKLAELEPVLQPGQLLQIQQMAAQTTLSEPIADYILALVQATRQHGDIAVGCSPRCSVQFSHLAKAWAFLQQRPCVLPDDVKQLARWVMAHRLVTQGGYQSGAQRSSAAAIVDEILQQTPVPR